jgi:hypothetical protein
MSVAAFDPLRLLRTLRDHAVEYVVIGGFAGRRWGSPTVTNDLDICHARDRRNLEALASALRALDAHLRGAPRDLHFLLDARSLANGDSFTFETNAGNLDCLGTPAGTTGYGELARGAVAVDLGESLLVRFVSLDDLIRMKSAAGRPKDRIEVEILRAVKEENERRGV